MVENREWRLYYSHWGGCRLLDALIGGPDLARRYVNSLRRCRKNEWTDASWVDGGALIDFDSHKVLFFGEGLMVEMPIRRAMMAVLVELWPEFDVRWAYDGTSELAKYVGARLRPSKWDQRPTLRLARGRSHLCHLVSVVDSDGRLRFWPLWWHLSKAWHGPALLDRLPGPGISRIRLKKVPEGGAHIDVLNKRIGAWQTADTMGFFDALPDLWSGWHTERWDDRYENHVTACGSAMRVPELDLVEGVNIAESWICKRIFESYEDSPAGQVAKLAGILAPLAPGMEVGSDALADFAVRPTTAEWARFQQACARLRQSSAQSA